MSAVYSQRRAGPTKSVEQKANQRQERTAAAAPQKKNQKFKSGTHSVPASVCASVCVPVCVYQCVCVCALRPQVKSKQVKKKENNGPSLGGFTCCHEYEMHGEGAAGAAAAARVATAAAAVATAATVATAAATAIGGLLQVTLAESQVERQGRGSTAAVQ